MMQFALNTLAEVSSMSQDPSSSMSKFAEHPVAKKVGSTVPLIRAAVLAVSVAAAIPTAHNLYYSWAHGIPYAEVPHRLAQYDLWMTNLDCKIDYRQLLTAAGSKVDVGACQKSGDIAIKVSSAGQSSYEWIAFKTLQKPTVASLFGLIVSPAVAEEAQALAKAPAGSFKVAEAGMEVKCQTKQGGDKLVRVVQEAGKCFRETMSMLKGSVEKREEVPCSTQCK
jgi:hypothetical protein